MIQPRHLFHLVSLFDRARTLATKNNKSIVALLIKRKSSRRKTNEEPGSGPEFVPAQRQEIDWQELDGEEPGGG
jgi:hypothetical protein